MIKIIRSEFMGFCYGAKRAIDMVSEVSEAYLLGAIVHNPKVMNKVKREGKIIKNTLTIEINTHIIS